MSNSKIDPNRQTAPPDPDKATSPKDTHQAYKAPDHDDMRIEITENGPYIVHGNVPLTEDAIAPSADGSHLEYHRVREFDTKETYALCRCGHSKHMPFCDGTHARIGFDGTETADRTPYLQRADQYPGPELDLLDDNRCAFARLCHRGGVDVWNLTEQADTVDMERQAIGGSWNCPTGRLEHHDDETGEVFEQNLVAGITILEDPQEGASGPLFVHGGITLSSSDGESYEQRNRYALCRCGASTNKPFCDAMHDSIGFNDNSAAFEEEWSGERDNAFKDMPDAEELS